jgi:sortase A
MLGVWGVARLHSIIGARLAIRHFRESEARTPARDSFAADGLPSDVRVDSTQWSLQRIAAYKASVTRKMDLPVAILLIPKIGLQAPVFNGADDLTLNRGLGRIPGTAWVGQSGNLGIAGHRDGFFRGLQNIRTGDTIQLHQPRHTDTYVVTEIRIVTADDVSVLDPTPMPTLTLITCFPFYFVGHAPERYVVTASIAGGRVTNVVDGKKSVRTDINSQEKEQQQ